MDTESVIYFIVESEDNIKYVFPLNTELKLIDTNTYMFGDSL